MLITASCQIRKHGSNIIEFMVALTGIEWVSGQFRATLPEPSNALSIAWATSSFNLAQKRGTLDDLVENRYATLLENATREYREQTIVVPDGTRVIEPDDGEIPLKALAAVHLRAAITTAQQMIGLDPYLLIPMLRSAKSPHAKNKLQPARPAAGP